jgi:hypothetical protein
MQELTYISDAEEKAYKNRAGQTFSYNGGVPGNIKKITGGEFWAEIEHIHPTHFASAQIHDADFQSRMAAAGRPESMHRYGVHCTLFFFEQFVLVVELEREPREPITPHYYKIATCFHELVEEYSVGMFEHHLKCTMCPYTTVVDSSD